jgi:hypothetical protein
LCQTGIIHVALLFFASVARRAGINVLKTYPELRSRINDGSVGFTWPDAVICRRLINVWRKAECNDPEMASGADA